MWLLSKLLQRAMVALARGLVHVMLLCLCSCMSHCIVPKYHYYNRARAKEGHGAGGYGVLTLVNTLDSRFRCARTPYRQTSVSKPLKGKGL